jgi:hypothetical protein
MCKVQQWHTTFFSLHSSQMHGDDTLHLLFSMLYESLTTDLLNSPLLTIKIFVVMLVVLIISRLPAVEYMH